MYFAIILGRVNFIAILKDTDLCKCNSSIRLWITFYKRYREGQKTSIYIHESAILNYSVSKST